VKPWSTPNDVFTYVSLEDIEAGTGQILSLRPTLGREIASTKSRFQRGDLLYSRLRPYLQKVVIAPSEGVAATELMVLRVQGPVEPEFLQEALLGPDHHTQVTQLMSGARMPRIRAEQLLDLPIVLPPREVQRRIVRALAVLRHRLGALRQRAAEGLVLVEQFEQTLLKAAFDGRLSATFRSPLDTETGEGLLADLAARRRATWEAARDLPVDGDRRATGARYPVAGTPEVADRYVGLPSTWVWASLSEIASAVDPLCYGVVEPGDDIDEGVPLVRVQDIKAGEINRARMRRISDAIDRRNARSRLKGGEVLVSLVGTVVGQVARVPPELAGANIARAVAKVTPIDAGLEEWVALVLQSPALQAWMIGSARGVAQNTLNLSRLARAPIPLAPPDERAWILEELQRRRTTLSGLREKLKDVEVALDSLWTTVRTRVLKGTLVLADPGDEAVTAARAVRFAIEEGRHGGARGKTRRVTATKLKSGDPAARRDLQSVLGEHPVGLEPLRLLEEAGYGLQDVEAFFKALAEAVAAGRVREQRSTADWPVLVVA
jgi:type I restriction enzyme S subunit